MNLSRISSGVLVLLALVGCGSKAQGPAAGQMPPQLYPTAVLEKQDAELQSVYPATIKGREDIEIRPRIDGFIEEIYVDEGSVVKKGQALFRINSPSAEQLLLTAQAGVVSAEALLSTAKLNVEKTRPLATKGIVSDYQLKTVENAEESAQASLKQAKAVLSNAQATKSWATVTSPVSGVVGAIPFRLGSLVNSAISLTTISNTSDVFVYFSLNEKELLDFLRDTPGKTQAEKIKGSAQVLLVLADGSSYSEKGKIETITGSVNTQTGTVNFRASFANPSGLLRSGSSGKILIPTIKHDVVVIPQKATFSLQDKVLTYKVQGDTVVQTLIDVLPMPGGQSYAVIGGLNAGDRIVTEGVASLSNGKKIEVQ